MKLIQFLLAFGLLSTLVACAGPATEDDTMEEGTGTEQTEPMEEDMEEGAMEEEGTEESAE
ncbi:hypothetical protein C7271_04060 [filamentous cyanobacterium CCP5]|nr:hypothetical protein C7271_04060 [filamentous cyanobacterium CCP5]